MPELDNHLMKCFQNGDESAFTRLVRRHEGPLIKYIAQFIGNRDAAEDLAQETFIRIFQAAPRYEPGRAQFNTWMYHIASNLCKNELRNRARREQHRVDNTLRNEDAEAADAGVEGRIGNAPADATYQPDVVLERKELRKELRNAIAVLTAAHREPLVLRDIQGLSYKEISKVLGIHLGTAKTRVLRARLILKERLQPYVENP